MKLNKLLVVVICCTGLGLAQRPFEPSASPAAGGSSYGPPPDLRSSPGTQVRKNIEKGLQQEPSLANVKIKVSVTGARDDKIELKGTVPSEDARKTAVQIAENNAGRMKIVDRLKVLSAVTSPSTPAKN